MNRLIRKIPFIGIDSLLANNAASPRSKDRIDHEELSRLRSRQKDREPELE
jgi:hypothetical protein